MVILICCNNYFVDFSSCKYGSDSAALTGGVVGGFVGGATIAGLVGTTFNILVYSLTDKKVI